MRFQEDTKTKRRKPEITRPLSQQARLALLRECFKDYKKDDNKR